MTVAGGAASSIGSYAGCCGVVVVVGFVVGVGIGGVVGVGVGDGVGVVRDTWFRTWYCTWCDTNV